MDIAIEILRVDAPLLNNKPTLKAGDITMVREALKTHIDAPRSTAPNKAQIIVMGCPVGALQRMREILLQAEYPPTRGSYVNDKFVPNRKRFDRDSKGKNLEIRAREWSLVLGDLSTAQRLTLLSPPYGLKVSWASFRGRAVKRTRDSKAFDIL